MVVNVDEELAVGDGGAHPAEALEAGRVHSDNAVELKAPPGLLDDVVRVEEPVLLGNGVLIPASHLLPFVAQGQREPELRADAIPVRADVADDAKRLAGPNALDDTIYDFGVRLQRTLLFRAVRRQGLFKLLDDLQHFVSTHYRIIHDELQGGGILQDDGPADEALDALSMASQQ